MTSYKQEDWYKAELKKYLEKYSVVPPPWVFAPDSHPYSIRWRMGAGGDIYNAINRYVASNC